MAVGDTNHLPEHDLAQGTLVFAIVGPFKNAFIVKSVLAVRKPRFHELRVLAAANGVEAYDAIYFAAAAAATGGGTFCRHLVCDGADAIGRRWEKKM
jgi:hypothetical protein